MKSKVYYKCSELVNNDEIDMFVKQVYLAFYNDARYKNLVDEYGRRFDIKRPHIYFHNMSTTTMIRSIVLYLINKVHKEYLSVDYVVYYAISVIEQKLVKFSVLDNIIAQQLLLLKPGSELIDVILSRNAIGEDDDKIFFCKSK
jgi:hypothetical protein